MYRIFMFWNKKELKRAMQCCIDKECLREEDHLKPDCDNSYDSC